MTPDRRAHPRGNPDRRKDWGERQARAEWVMGRKPGMPVAHFAPGQEVRCPCQHRHDDGRWRLCGALLGDSFKGAVNVFAYGHRTRPARGQIFRSWCWSCAAAIEIETVAVTDEAA